MREQLFTRLTERQLTGVVLALVALTLGLSGWLDVDAFVTLRTIDNLFNGHGLVWNPGERVQAYTHPLWLFANAGLIALTGHYELTCLLLAVALSLASFCLVLLRLAPTVRLGAVMVLALLLSKAYVDYATSGLEDPLTRLILVLFVLTRLGPDEGGRGGFGGSYLRASLAALATLSRPDALLVFLPALARRLWDHRSWKSLFGLALGFVPLALWGGFAIFYYGSPFPNTAYAKLGMGVPRVGLVVQGLAYLFDSLIRDPATLTMIFGGLVLALRRPRSVDLPLLVGAWLYLAYVIWIGGDYMSGRFLSLPLLATVLSFSRYEWPPIRRDRRLLFLALVFVPRCVEPLIQNEVGIFGIGDERRSLHPHTGLVYLFVSEPWPEHTLRSKGEASRTGPPIRMEGEIGLSPFYGGPGVYVIDLYALSDPLRARLPGFDTGTFNGPFHAPWRAGHVHRPMPEGYFESLESGENRIVDPDLARYYDVLRFVVRGPLMDPARIRAAVELTLGVYDPLVQAYVERNRHVFRRRQP